VVRGDRRAEVPAAFRGRRAEGARGGRRAGQRDETGRDDGAWGAGSTLSDDSIAIGYRSFDCAAVCELKSTPDFRNIFGKFRSADKQVSPDSQSR
jgi:hypothetical protein